MAATAVAAPSPDDDRRIPSIIVALIGVMSREALEEVFNVLRRRLYAIPSARDLRGEELWLLRRLLTANEEERIGGDLPYVRRLDYEAARSDLDDSASAPASSTLHDRYASWTQACLAAASIDDDGAFVGPWNAWPHGMLGRRGHRYTHAEAIAAVRQCAEAIGRPPSSAQYNAWRNAHAALLRRRGIKPYVPTMLTVYRLLAPVDRSGTRWREVLRRAQDGGS